jgi:hypothetical protein
MRAGKGRAGGCAPLSRSGVVRAGLAGDASGRRKGKLTSGPRSSAAPAEGEEAACGWWTGPAELG